MFLKEFLEFVTNEVFLVPACAWIIAQICKATLNFIITKSFSPARLFGDGGMPSGHSATVMALVVMCGVTSGFGSTSFGISIVLAAIVMHDALGVRRETGKQGEVLNQILSQVLVEGKPITEKQLKELVGHTPLEVLGGVIVGALITLFFI